MRVETALPPADLNQGVWCFMNTNFTMNAIACKQAKDIFDHMLMTDMPG